jgi:hypothetical protein
MIQWFKSAKNEEVKKIEEKLSSMPLKDKINILSLIDVDLDSYFANLIYQKMINDDKIKAKIEKLLNTSSSKLESSEPSVNAPSSDLNEGPLPETDEALPEINKEEIKNKGNEEGEEKSKKIKHIKLKKDEFTTKANLEKSAIDTPLAHERDVYSIWQDYSAHDGYTAYDPSYPEDYIVDDIAYNSYDTSDKNIKGVKYKKIIWFKNRDKDEKNK